MAMNTDSHVRLVVSPPTVIKLENVLMYSVRRCGTARDVSKSITLGDQNQNEGGQESNLHIIYLDYLRSTIKLHPPPAIHHSVSYLNSALMSLINDPPSPDKLFLSSPASAICRRAGLEYHTKRLVTAYSCIGDLFVSVTGGLYQFPSSV